MAANNGDQQLPAASMETTKDMGTLPASVGRVTPHVILSGLIAACSGMIFGYNIGVSGGVTSMGNFLQSFFPGLIARSQKAQESTYCKFNDQALQAFTSSLFLAGLVSTFAASYVTNHMGRRSSMIIGGLLSLCGVAITAGGKHLVMLIIGRILLGFGTGFANQAAPMYLSEIAPSNLRGVLSVLFQMMVGVGIFTANLVNFGVGYLSPTVGWRIALACAGAPALMLGVGGLLLVESPISLIERERHADGRAMLEKVRGTKNVEVEFDEMVRSCVAAKAVKQAEPLRAVLKPNSRPQLIIAVCFAVFQQMTGINAIMFYAPVLFQTVGFRSNASLYSAAIIGAVNVSSTIASMLIVDRVGRKVLLIEGGVQMLISQIAIGAILATNLKDVSGAKEAIPLAQGPAIAVVLLICVFVAGFGWSWGPLTWLICSEVFPLETRSAGQSFVVFGNLMATFTVAQLFLSMLCGMKYGIFLFFAAWVVVMTVFVWFFVPETRSIPLESIEQVWRTHWFWKKMVPSVGTLPISTQARNSNPYATEERNSNPDANQNNGSTYFN